VFSGGKENARRDHMDRAGVEVVGDYRRRINATASIAAAPIPMGNQ
jgi:hypothetical protein